MKGGQRGPQNRICPRCLVRICDHDLLTGREMDALRMLQITSLSSKQMAWRLGISPHAMKLFLNHLYRKLGVHSRLEAYEWACRHADLVREA